MKKLFATLSLVLGVSMLAQAQLVISEIMFNPPESGSDSLEFIEIYNAGANAVDLDGHYIVFGNNVRDSFNGSFMLAPGGLVVTAVNDSACFNQYNMSSYPRQWRSNAGLGNNGSTIRLHNNSGTIIDSVAYLSAWQNQAAGNGSSLILCNPTADNNVSTNWSFSTTNTGNVINSRPLSGSPGVLESCPVINYPLYTISQINGLNANGAPDSANVYCEIRAIVHSGDFRGGAGYDFAFINSDNVGITVFVLNNIGGYTVTQGDSLHLRGFVTQFNGTLQFSPDSIFVATSGNALVSPLVTTVVNETTENKLVKLENVVLIDTVNTSPAGLTIRVRNASDTFEIRIDNDVNAFGATLLSDSFNITGIGRQNDVVSPYDSAYQVLVRGISDFEFLGAVAVQRFDNTLEIKLFPNPTNQILFVQSAAIIENIVISNAIGQQVAQANNIQQEQLQINTANLPAGIYQATIYTDKGSESRRFVVQH